MPLWGKSTADESKPKYLTVEEQSRTRATSAGWVLRHDKGNGRFYDELLVSIAGLNVALGTADISEVFFANSAAAYVRNNADAYVTVSFNEAVTVTGGTPTLAVTGSTSGAITASYMSGTGTNKLLFKFTVPNVAQTLSIGAQTVAAGGATVAGADAGAASLVVQAGDIKPVRGRNTGSATVTVA